MNCLRRQHLPSQILVVRSSVHQVRKIPRRQADIIRRVARSLGHAQFHGVLAAFRGPRAGSWFNLQTALNEGEPLFYAEQPRRERLHGSQSPVRTLCRRLR